VYMNLNMAYNVEMNFTMADETYFERVIYSYYTNDPVSLCNIQEIFPLCLISVCECLLECALYFHVWKTTLPSNLLFGGPPKQETTHNR
jgi:hypothetical protein